jgi:hypothetical protein
LLPAEAAVAGRDLHPLKNRAFPWQTTLLRLSGLPLFTPFMSYAGFPRVSIFDELPHPADAKVEPNARQDMNLTIQLRRHILDFLQNPSADLEFRFRA